MMKQVTKVSLVVCSLLPASVMAAIGENTSDTSLGSFINRIKSYLLGFVGALAVLFIIIGGFQMVTSSGEPKKLETAKKTLTYAIIGLLVVILAQALFMLLTGSLSNIFGSGIKTL